MAATKTRLLTVEQASQEYGFTPRQLRRFITERKVSIVKPSGKTGPAFFIREDMERFLAERTIPADQ